MMSDEITLHLTCHCGTHRYPVQVPKATLPLRSWTCHCLSCRHISGAPFITHAALPQLANIFPGFEPPTFVGLPEGLSCYITPPRGARVFCTTCGTCLAGVWKVASMGGTIQWPVTMGALDLGSHTPKEVYEDFSLHYQVAPPGDGGFARWLDQQRNFLATWPGLEFVMPEEVGPVVEHKDAEGREVRKAGCKCQGVRLGIRRPEEGGPLGRKWKAHLCFCTDCRLSLGHLLPSFISVDNDYITWLEKGTLKTYDSSPEKGTQRLFCGKCGASVGKRLPGRSELDVNLGMLELEGEGEEGGKGEGLAGVLREWTVWEKPRFMAEAGDGRLRDEILSGMKRDGFILD